MFGRSAGAKKYTDTCQKRSMKREIMGKWRHSREGSLSGPSCTNSFFRCKREQELAVGFRVCCGGVDV